MQRAAGSAREARTVQEDACAVDNARAVAFVVSEHPAGDRACVVLESLRIKRRRQRTDEPGLVLAVEISPDRATSLAQALRRFSENPEAAPTPDTRPP